MGFNKRDFLLGLAVGFALSGFFRSRRESGLTQERLDNYYHKRARYYNLTDYLYYPRITMRKTLIEMVDLKPGMRVLDFACGAGANFPYIMEKIGPTGTLVATDYSQDMLDSAHEQFVIGRGWKNIELVQADAAQMHFDEPFDVIICTLGLAVIPGYEEAMERAWEMVKPGGLFGVADLRESTRWYTLPLRFVTEVMDVLIIANSQRRPWEWMQANGSDYRYRDVFHGFMYSATIRKPDA